MKFVPVNMDEGARRTPFCSSIRGGLHRISEPGKCAECGVKELTSETSDHMNVKGGAVILCLECARMYLEFHELSLLVGA